MMHHTSITHRLWSPLRWSHIYLCRLTWTPRRLYKKLARPSFSSTIVCKHRECRILTTLYDLLSNTITFWVYMTWTWTKYKFMLTYRYSRDDWCFPSMYIHYVRKIAMGLFIFRTWHASECLNNCYSEIQLYVDLSHYNLSTIKYNFVIKL